MLASCYNTINNTSVRNKKNLLISPSRHVRNDLFNYFPYRLFNKVLIGIVSGDAAADSDTNSHCALLVDDSTSSPPTTSYSKNPNGNNNYELHDFHPRDSSAQSSSHRQATSGRLSTPDTTVTQNIWLKYHLENLFSKGRFNRAKKGPLATPLDELFKRKPRRQSKPQPSTDSFCWGNC